VKNAIAFVVAILLVAAGAGYLVSTLQTARDKALFEKAVAEARVDFVRQAALVNLVPDDKVTFDRQLLMKKHLDQMEVIKKQFPELMKEDGFINDMESKAKEGKKDKAKTAEYRTRYDYVKEMWGTLKTGGYKPALTHEDHGFRFDILSIKKATEAGQTGLRMDAFLWGAIKDQITFGNLEVVVLREKDDPKKAGKKIQGVAKINGAGPPYVLQDKPWDWITEWPPGVMVGYYVGIPALPPEAVRMTLRMDFQLRTSAGTSIPVAMEWKNLPVEPGWKGSGSEWEGEVEQAEPEELKSGGFVEEVLKPGDAANNIK
jgi:hypothetical protein